MKVSEQCSIAASKGNQILRLIRRSITYENRANKAMVMPHLEYCSQPWRPYCEDIIIIIIALFADSIQHRSTLLWFYSCVVNSSYRCTE